MNDMIAAGPLEVTEPTVVPWGEWTVVLQAMRGQRHAGVTCAVNHALPALGLRSSEALSEPMPAGKPA